MNTELIKITEQDNGEMAVMGRDLYEFLEVKTRYNDWIAKLIKKYGFLDNTDFVAVTQKKVAAQGNEVEYTDHVLTMDMAKEISMVTNNEKGKQARQYFIEAEKQRNQLLDNAGAQPKLPTYAESLRLYADELDRNAKLEQQHQEDIPKVDFHDKVAETTNTIPMSEMSNFLKQNGIDIGRNRLFDQLREDGLIQKYSTLPTQYAMNLGIFKVTEHLVKIKGEYQSKYTTRVTGRGQQYLIKKYTK